MLRPCFCVGIVIALPLFAMLASPLPDGSYAFFDIASFIFVVGLGVAYAAVGNYGTRDRIKNFGNGCVAAGWLGIMIGLTVMLAHGEMVFYDPSNQDVDLYKKIALAMVCLVYGYWFKSLAFVVEENLPD